MTVKVYWEIHKFDVGTVIELSVVDENGSVVSVATATTKEILLRKPNGDVLTKTAEFSTDGTDGKIRYVTIAGDLNYVGTWRAQAVIVTPTQSWKSEDVEFEVQPNLA